MKLLKRFFLVLLVLVLAFAILLAGSIAIDYALGRDRLDTITNVTIPGISGGPDVRAYVAKPDEEGPFPTL
ncbi:MAG: hypothetical protein ACXW4E_10455, partial [Anaerolineales bacterium]